MLLYTFVTSRKVLDAQLFIDLLCGLGAHVFCGFLQILKQK